MYREKYFFEPDGKGYVFYMYYTLVSAPLGDRLLFEQKLEIE